MILQMGGEEVFQTIDRAGDIAWTLHEAIRMMMGRRSIRKFKDRRVEPDKVQVILECAFAAPSSNGRNPCNLMVIDDRELLKKMGESTPEAAVFTAAPLAVAVCVDVPAYEEKYDLRDGTWIEDSACCMENILLSAKVLGLGSVWIKVYNREPKSGALVPLLGLPEGVLLFAIAAIGYPDEHKPPHSGIDEDRIHINKW